jgi:hypothetical protein
VAAGDYAGSYQDGTEVRMVEGISLYGGFDPTFDVRNPASFVSRIVDTSTAGGTSAAPNRAVTIPVGVGPGTVLDGFFVEGGGGVASAAVVTDGDAAAEIRNNVLRGGRACTSPTCASYGLRVGSPVRVIGNTIGGFNGDSSVGVHVVAGNALIANNVVVAGYGYPSTGLLVDGGAPRILNNTIRGGTLGINGSAGSAILENNIVTVTGTGPGQRYCIYLAAPTAFNPLSIKNNDLTGCGYVLNRWVRTWWCPSNCYPGLGCTGCSWQWISSRPYTSALAVGGGNVSVDPSFADSFGGDYHLMLQTPASVAEGGLDLSATLQTDKDGRARTVPWSIGAYERQHMCAPTLVDCDGEPANGCEANISTSLTNCGACGQACPAGWFCVGGGCAAGCPPSMSGCGELCLDAQIDAANCGACGRVCPSPANGSPGCSAGQCGVAACNSDWGD